MKKISKTCFTLLGAISLLGSLAACGSQNNKNDTVEIVFWHSFGKTVQDSLQKKISSFEAAIKEHEGVNVKISQVYKGDYKAIRDMVKKSFSTATTPTITVAYPDHVADYLDAESTKGQYVVRLDDYMSDSTIGFGKESYLGDELGLDDFVESYIQEGQNYVYDGTYSLPFMKSTEVMFYNVEAVTKALKLYKPETTSEQQVKDYINTLTWDELMKFSKFIDGHRAEISNALVPEVDKDGNETKTAPVFYDSDENALITYMNQNNIDYSSIDANGHGTIDYATGENRANLSNLLLNFKKQYDEGLFCTKGSVGTYGSYDFTAMKCLFSIGSTGGSGYNFPQADLFTVGAAKAPIMNNNPKYISQGVTLALLKGPQYSTEQNELKTKYGWKFMKYITNTEINTEINILGSEGYMPVRESCYETDNFIDFMSDETNKYAPVADVVINQIQGKYFNSPVFPGSAQLRTETGGLFTSVLKDIKNASSKTDEQIKTEIDALITKAVDNANLSIK